MITEELTSTPGMEAEAPAITKPFREPFNWETEGKDGNRYSAEEPEMLEKLYDTTMRSVAEYEIVDGKRANAGCCWDFGSAQRDSCSTGGSIPRLKLTINGAPGSVFASTSASAFNRTSNEPTPSSLSTRMS